MAKRKGYIVTSQAVGETIFYLVSPRQRAAGSTGKKLYAWDSSQSAAHIFKTRDAALTAVADVKRALQVDARNAPHRDYIMIHNLEILDLL